MTLTRLFGASIAISMGLALPGFVVLSVAALHEWFLLGRQDQIPLPFLLPGLVLGFLLALVFLRRFTDRRPAPTNQERSPSLAGW